MAPFRKPFIVVLALLLLGLSLGYAQALDLSTKDGLSLKLSGQGAVTGVSVAGKALPAGGAGGFSIIDVAAGGKTAPVTGAVANDTFSGQAETLKVALTARYEVTDSFIRAHCTVRDLTGGDRGIVVYFSVPVDAAGWNWWQDIQTTKPIEANKTYEDASGVRAFPGIAEYMGQPGLDVGRHSRLFAAAITGPAGLSYAAPLDEFRIFRTGYDGSRQQFYIAFDLALCQETKVPSEATFTFLIQRVAPQWGLRDALHRYYTIYPGLFTKIIETRKQPEGIWMPFEDLENIQDSNEFGFRVQEGANNSAYDDLMGVDSLPYYGGGSELIWVPDYKPGKDSVPPYETLVDIFNQQLEKRYNIKNGYSEACIWNKDGQCSITDAAPYGHFGSQLDANSAFQYGQALLQNMGNYFESRQKQGSRLDGVYYDGLAAGLDYNRAHFKDASFPPIWDPVAQKPLLYNYFSSLDFARTASEKLHAEGRMAMTNGAMSSDMFTAPYLDYMGEETGLNIPRSGFNFVRAICYRKTFMTLLKGDYTKYTHADIEHYMQRCVAYGVFPGFFDWYTSGTGPGSSYWVHPEYYNRDRDLFRKYIPLCRMIASTGWEPLTLARCDNPQLFVERWGRGTDNNLAFTVLSESVRTEQGTLTLPAALGLGNLKDLIAYDQISGRKLNLTPATNGEAKLALQLPPDGFALVQVMPRKTFVVSQARLIRDIIAAGRLQMTVDAKRQRHDLPRLWVTRNGAKNFTAQPDSANPHSGKLSLLCDNSAGVQRNSCYTWVNLHQQRPAPFTISAWSRAEGVDGNKDDNYCLCFSTCHVTNYTETTEHTLQFEPGTHGWQQVSLKIEPTETIDAVMLAPQFQGHKGKVWFDDITLTTEDGKQWVIDPGFESWDLQPKSNDPLLARLNVSLDTLTKAAATLASAGDPMPTLAAIQSQTRAATTALAPQQATFGRALRDLDDCARLANATVAGLYQLPALTLDLPTRLVPGDVVPVGVKLAGTSDLKFDPKRTSVTLTADPAWPLAARDGKWLLTVPATVPLEQRVQVTARATLLINGKTPIQTQTTGTAITAPRSAGDLQVVDILDDGLTFITETALQNNGNKPVRCSLQPVAPEGWTVTGPAALSVAARGEGRARFVFKAPVSAPMGRYTFLVRASSGPGETVAHSAAAWFIPPQANRVANPSFEEKDGKLAKSWGPYDKGYAVAADAHSGTACLKCSNPDGEGSYGASQAVNLNQQTAAPVVIRGFSKCQNVTGAPEASYSVYADIYYTDGSALYGQTLQFATGTQGWQYLERVIEPAKPIRTVNLYAFIRSRRGTVWFDDLVVAEDGSQKGNVALADDGTKVTTDSNYTGYTPVPLTDGVIDVTGLEWAQAAWASADNDKEHWIELAFPKPTPVSRVAIYWNSENKVTFTSQSYQVQAWVNGTWRTVAAVQDQPAMPVSIHTFAPVTTDRLRLLQAPKGGSAERAGIMWVTEVKVF